VRTATSPANHLTSQATGLSATADEARREARIGVLCGVTAYGLWGLIAIYFKYALAVGALPFEIVAHRIVWCVVLLGMMVTVRRRWGALWRVITTRRSLVALISSAALIGFNWALFIYAIESKQLLQASLGYFINPLLSVLLGFIFLRERLRPWQFISVVLATIAVGYLTVSKGAMPVLALGMACSFGLYGLIRKVARVEAIGGLLVETTLLLPLALIYLARIASRGESHFFDGMAPAIVLLLAGPVTAIPLMLFVASARRLKLATVGFLQYLAPTGQFLLAVAAYGEPFDRNMGIAFAGIWIALAIYSVDTLRAQRRGP
jgi:chloramphenicol-sensitive protein RarD